MALIDEVRDRYSTQLLVNVSNPQSSGATTEDTTRSANAVDDVQAAFKVYAGVTYDNTVDTHIMVAVDGVIARLMLMTEQPGGAERWKEFIERLKDLALVTGRDRIQAESDSLLLPTTDTSGDLPATDRKNFAGYIPNAPNQPTTQD